eukprot:TRINITY_DN3829_c0_g2_i1.p1 TRINITY_DN3829_c0_g2~~TRINITY_DN3829_c0_g2_i1.p1  ORF type:complete len:201 (+),score=55.47 TRINITY_DN3829_c0_g2_i1:624-1226(+)
MPSRPCSIIQRSLKDSLGCFSSEELFFTMSKRNAKPRDWLKAEFASEKNNASLYEFNERYLSYGTLLLPGLELLSQLFPSGRDRANQIPPMVSIEPNEGILFLAGKNFSRAERLGCNYPQFYDSNNFLLAFGYVPHSNPYDKFTVNIPTSIQLLNNKTKDIAKVIKFWEQGSYDDVIAGKNLEYSITKEGFNDKLMNYIR